MKRFIEIFFVGKREKWSLESVPHRRRSCCARGFDVLTLRRAWDVLGSRTGSVTPSTFEAFHRSKRLSLLVSLFFFFFRLRVRSFYAGDLSGDVALRRSANLYGVKREKKSRIPSMDTLSNIGDIYIWLPLTFTSGKHWSLSWQLHVEIRDRRMDVDIY